MAKKQAFVRDYQNTFKSAQGKRVLYDLAKEHYVMSSTYVKGDPQDLAFREGQRQVVLRILTILKTDAEAFVQFLEETHDNAMVDD